VDVGRGGIFSPKTRCSENMALAEVSGSCGGRVEWDAVRNRSGRSKACGAGVGVQTHSSVGVVFVVHQQRKNKGGYVGGGSASEIGLL